MKVDRLISKNQPSDWLETITNECAEYPIHLMMLDSEDLIIDVGANVGGFMKAWGFLSTNWYLVEPSKYNQEQIKINLAGLEYKLFKNAVSDVSGKILKLQNYINGETNEDTPSGNMGVTGFVYEENNHGWQGDYEEVESVCFDSLIGDKDVGLLKVDCEGGEYDFLMNRNLANIKYITMELHNFLGVDKQKELCNWIENTHEKIYSQGDGTGHYLIAWSKK